MNAPAHPPGSAKRPPIAVLIAVSAVNPLALNIFVPSMPGMERAFATTYAQVQLTLSVYLGAVAISQLLIGPLSDRFGRRPVMLVGLALFLVGTLICRFSPTVDVMILGRVVQGAGSCTGLVLSRAIVRDLYERDRAASMIGYVTMGMAVAPTLGPALGGWLDELYGWQASFDLLLVFGGAALAAAWATLHETNHSPTRGGGPADLIRGFATLLGSPLFCVYALASTFTSAVFFAYLGGAPYVAQKLMGIPSREVGLWFVTVAAGYILGNFVSGRYAVRLGTRIMMAVGNVGALAACVAIGVLLGLGVWHPVAIFGPAALLGLSNGIALPSTIAGAVSVRPELAGAASGLIGSLQVGTGAVVTVVMGLTLADTPWPLVVAMVGLAAAALVSGSLARRSGA